jgi:hypothetical protein
MSLGQGERKKEEEPRNARLSVVKRLAVPRALLELGPSQLACISPILTAFEALAMAGSELRKRAPRVLGSGCDDTKIMKY